MSASTRDRIAALVREHLKDTLTPADHTLIRLAWFDLWYGPFTGDIEGEEYPGWVAASERLAEIRDALPITLYVDLDCDYVGEEEPEGFEEDTGEVDEDGNPILEWVEPEEYYTVDRDDIARAVLGKDIVAHL